MGFKGTPGPWVEHRNGFSTVYVEARLRQGVIQEVAACGPTEAGSEAQSANARLIAAAPELLEALIEMQRNGRKQGWNDNYESSMKKTELAINKALGRE
ncbi:hypothetical protein [Morganella morganii]|uniref:hypothetical protein n=1 Tax=Morganella morganii TaxID=582 RepID=UPI003EB7CCF1